MSDSIYPKAPSVLFYDENMKYLNKFGYKAKRAANNSEKGVLLTNFKPLLARDFDNAVDDGLLKKLNDNTTVDAIINYIRDFVGEGIKRMDVNEKVDKKRLSYVVTVPSMWSDEAKNTMAVAIRRAGIVELNPGETLDDRVIFITEAEAAALYCQEFFKKEFKITKDQRFMICDCGGGTVDLGTFQVGQENGGERELTITELTSGDGGNCGSAYIDDRFRYYLLERLLKCSTPYDEEGVFETVDYFIKEIKVIHLIYHNHYSILTIYLAKI
jgi:molecular chaperone DnaK (HSP70)